MGNQRQAPELIPVEVGDGSHRFRLDDVRRGSCEHRGWANDPAWSPVGDEISFFAAPAAAERLGFERASALANMYMFSVDRTTARLVLGGLRQPRALSYSPDGTSLAFSAEVEGVSGTWVMDTDDGDLVRVLDRQAAWLSWSPGGGRIAMLIEVRANLDETELTLIDVMTPEPS